MLCVFAATLYLLCSLCSWVPIPLPIVYSVLSWRYSWIEQHIVELPQNKYTQKTAPKIGMQAVTRCQVERIVFGELDFYMPLMLLICLLYALKVLINAGFIQSNSYSWPQNHVLRHLTNLGAKVGLVQWKGLLEDTASICDLNGSFYSTSQPQKRRFRCT